MYSDFFVRKISLNQILNKFFLSFTIFVPKLYLGTHILCFYLILAGCDQQKTPVIHANVDACLQCGMSISQLNQACGYYYQSEFQTFCAGQCLLTRYQSIEWTKRPAAANVYFADFQSSDLVTVDSLEFLLTNHITTVMNAGVISFKDHDLISSYKKHDDELITDWRGFQIVKGKPDRTVEVTISQKGIEPEVTMLNKGELVEWIITPENENIQDLIMLKGYDEMHNIKVKVGGFPVKIRMLADKPGAGFPFIRSSDNQIIGMVKVAGAHTSDEEVM